MVSNQYLLLRNLSELAFLLFFLTDNYLFSIFNYGKEGSQIIIVHCDIINVYSILINEIDIVVF